MDLPALLPKELKYTSVAETNRNLFNILIKNPQDFIVFFEYATDDETWSEKHSEFMTEAIQWMTNRYFQDKFMVEMAHRAIAKIREHYYILDPFVPKNLTFLLNGSKNEVSSLMWGGSSEYLRNMIRQECRDRNTKTLELEDVTPEVFDQVEEYIKTGDVKGLLSKEKDEILDVLHQATEWGLLGLMELCQGNIKKYISRSNVIEILIEAHDERWQLLKDFCIDFINDLDVGVQLDKTSQEILAMEFLNFREDAMEIFEAMRFNITHLICGHNLTDEAGFSDVINRCPSMVCLDISRTRSFTDRLLDIPDPLEELDISKCEWLTNKNFKKMIEICPNLIKILLASNAQLNYSTWAMLKDLRRLEKLDISRCYQIKDVDFKLILQACRNVTHFYLEECTGLSDNAFLELGKNIPNLTDLDASRTNISDSGLIDLMMRCKHLITLRVNHCTNFTRKGILDAVHNAPNLKILDITKCGTTEETLTKIKKARPFLELIG